MAKPKRTQKLKVFRTPIGFHDAYVAAPSQKAALEAWGTDTNLFARGAAEQVTDPDLAKVPLANPGQVVKVLRGTEAEQLAALEQASPARESKSRSSRVAAAEIIPKKPKKKPPKPSRAALQKAEEALEKLRDRQSQELAAIEKQERELERRRSELERRQERDFDKVKAKVEDEQERYREAIRRYESG